MRGSRGRASHDLRPTALWPGFQQRSPERALRYRWMARLADVLAGWSDGRADALARRPVPLPTALTEAPPSPVVRVVSSSAPTMWLARNAHTFAERDRREFLVAQAQANPLLVRRDTLVAELASARAALREAQRRRAVLPPEPTAEMLGARGPAEASDDASVIASRRRKEHRRTVDAADAVVSEAIQRVERHRHELSAVLGTLDAAFESTRIRSARVRWYHERRASAYRRSYGRALHRSRRLSPAQLESHPVMTSGETVPVPAWTTQPCSWTTPPFSVDNAVPVDVRDDVPADR